MKIAFMTDIHANLPALQAALEKIQDLNCDEIIIIVDTFSIINPTRYFANYYETYSLFHRQIRFIRN